MDARLKTGIIIRRGVEYLVARQIGTRRLVWSSSPWDAWITRDRENAEHIAKITGGDMILFNPVVGQLRTLKS